MKIIYDKPPIFDRARLVFGPIVDGAIFCWGDTIYSPIKKEISVNLIDHEIVHSLQQEKIGIENWWDQYLISAEFRLQEEIPAHIEEYKSFCKTAKTRIQRRLYLKNISKRLSGPLYGNLLTFETARELIKKK